MGDTGAAAILDDAARALAELAADLLVRLDAGAGPIPLALVGGTFENPSLRTAVERRVAALAPSATIITPAHEPAVGAAFLAFDAAGIARPTLVSA